MAPNVLTKFAWWIGLYAGYLEPEFQVWTLEENTMAGQRGVSKLDGISRFSLQYRLFSKISKPAWYFICKLPMKTVFAGINHFWMNKFSAKSHKVTFSERADLPFFDPPPKKTRRKCPPGTCSGNVSYVDFGNDCQLSREENFPGNWTLLEGQISWELTFSL